MTHFMLILWRFGLLLPVVILCCVHCVLCTWIHWWKWYWCFDALLCAYSWMYHPVLAKRNQSYCYTCRVSTFLVLELHSLLEEKKSRGILCITFKAGPYSVRKKTTSQNTAGRFRESMSFCSVLQYRLMATANLLLLFSVAAKAKAKGNLCDPMISYWLMLQRDPCWRYMLEGSRRIPHSQGDNSLNVVHGTFYMACYDFCCSEVYLPKLNLGVFYCCCHRWCQTEDEMRGHFSLSYARACYLYCYEKCFR